MLRFCSRHGGKPCAGTTPGAPRKTRDDPHDKPIRSAHVSARRIRALHHGRRSTRTGLADKTDHCRGAARRRQRQRYHHPRGDGSGGQTARSADRGGKPSGCSRYHRRQRGREVGVRRLHDSCLWCAQYRACDACEAALRHLQGSDSGDLARAAAAGDRDLTRQGLQDAERHDCRRQSEAGLAELLVRRRRIGVAFRCRAVDGGRQVSTRSIFPSRARPRP